MTSIQPNWNRRAFFSYCTVFAIIVASFIYQDHLFGYRGCLGFPNFCLLPLVFPALAIMNMPIAIIRFRRLEKQEKLKDVAASPAVNIIKSQSQILFLLGLLAGYYAQKTYVM